jgi:hypothetical protein
MDFIVRALPFGREPGDGAKGYLGREAASDEGAYQTSPARGKPPPPLLCPHLDSPNGGFQCAIVELVTEGGNTLGEVAVDAAATELVGQPARAPSTIARAKLYKTLCKTFVVEKVELIKSHESLIDIGIVEPLPPQFFDQLDAKMIAPSNELESLVVGRIFQILNSQFLISHRTISKCACDAIKNS